MINQGKTRALALVMTLALTLSLLPGTALGVEPEIFTESPEKNGITVTPSNGGTFTYEEGSGFTLSTNGNYTISGTWGNEKAHGIGENQAVITVPNGVNANITLTNVTINVSGTKYASAFAVEAGGTANITLAESSTNTLTSGEERAGLEVPAGAAVTIGGTGSLSATGGYLGAGIGGGGYHRAW